MMKTKKTTSIQLKLIQELQELRIRYEAIEKEVKQLKAQVEQTQQKTEDQNQ